MGKAVFKWRRGTSLKVGHLWRIRKIKIQIDSASKTDKERIKALEAENARLKYEISFCDDSMKDICEIAKPNRAVKKHKQLPSKD